jgi:hypothetical protein
MWLKLSTSWLNMSNIVRVEFIEEKTSRLATVISVKPGGSDKTVYGSDDALLIEKYLTSTQSQKSKKSSS